MPNPEKSAANLLKESMESPRVQVLRPAVESLLDADGDSLWPDEVRKSPELRVQAESRRKLSSKLDLLLNKIPSPTMEISKAMEGGFVDPKILAETYDELSNFLESEPENNRLLLYLPFELIPREDWQINNQELRESVKRFSKNYLEHWNKLIKEHNFRANFSDGDIPELEVSTSPLPEVSKAAHLIPALVGKKIISLEDVIQLIENSRDEILRESIADVFPVLADLGLLSENDLGKMAESEDNLVRNSAIIVNSEKDGERKGEEGELKEKPAVHRDAEWLKSFLLRAKVDNDKVESDNKSKQGKIPLRRINWETKRDKERMIEKNANEVATALIQGTLSPLNLNEIAISPNDPIPSLIIVNGLREVVEILAKNGDLEKAKEIYLKFQTSVDELRKEKNDEIQESLERTWFRLASLGVIDEKQLEQFGLKVPKLDADFPLDDKNLASEFSKIASAIESNSELLKFVYPISIAYGSKVKGHDAYAADTDVAVFVRPGVKFEDREHIQEIISKTLTPFGIKDGALEFWLENKNGELAVKDFPNRDKKLGASGLVHVLFGGVWSGKNDSAKELYEKLLTGYLYSKGKKIHGENARKLWLEELERNVLQYRLMHKGYARFYPKQGGIQTKHADLIDAESAFYDSGYRQLATKLYLKKVFLPQLEKPRM